MKYSSRRGGHVHNRADALTNNFRECFILDKFKKCNKYSTFFCIFVQSPELLIEALVKVLFLKHRVM